MQFEFLIEDRREHVIVAEGDSLNEARQNALQTYYDRARQGELVPYVTHRPRIIETERRK